MNGSPNSFPTESGRTHSPASPLSADRIITYSPAYTLVPSYECFNRCDYCNFRVDPGQAPWMTLEQARDMLESLKTEDVIEILVLSGEVHPLSPRRVEWFQRLYDLCQLALEAGFLPHTNAGPLSLAEMAQLQTVNVSMGLMVEQMTPALLQTVHRHAPSKVPEQRIQQLKWAGQLGIPFTTGLLLGIGETEADWRQTLEAIALSHQQWGHIQEVILQPYRPGSRQAWSGSSFPLEQLVKGVAIARQILPDSITIQIPPNLVAYPSLLLDCLAAGARDLGGLGPVDEVNPDYPHPTPAQLAALLRQQGWQLAPRLPVYPSYETWLPDRLQAVVQGWQTRLKHLR